MKKAREIFDKYLIQIAVGLLVFFGTALWDFFTRFFTMPSRFEKMVIEQKIVESKINKLDSVLVIFKGYQADQWYVLKKYSEDLNLEHPQEVINNR